MTQEILPHVLIGHRFYRISTCGMYPVDVRGPTPPDTTPPKDLTLFPPFTPFYFLSFF